MREVGPVWNRVAIRGQGSESCALTIDTGVDQQRVVAIDGVATGLK